MASRNTISIGSLSDSGNKAASSSFSFTHVCEGPGSRVAVVFITGRDAGGAGDTNTLVTAITYGGVAMTLVDTVVSGAATFVRSTIYYIKNPPPGNNTVSITLGGSADQTRAVACCYGNVDQTTPVDGSNSDQQNAANATLSVTDVTNNALCLGSIIVNSTSAIGPNSGQTEDFEGGDGANYNMEINHIFDAVAGSQPMNMTNSANKYAYVLLALKPCPHRVRVN